MSRLYKSKPGVLSIAAIAALITAVAAFAGYFASRYVPEAILTPLLKYAIGVIGVVWFFSLTVYNKLADITDLSGLDFRQHRNIELEIRARMHWFWLRAIFLGLLALTMYVPTILRDAKFPIPGWVIGAAFAALALALFSLRRLWSELEEIRELRSYVKEIERREKERSDQVKTLRDGLKEGWQSDPHLDNFRKDRQKDDR